MPEGIIPNLDVPKDPESDKGRYSKYYAKLTEKDWAVKPQMEAYLKANHNAFRFFQTYGGDSYDIICGDGFYFDPMTKVVVISIPDFREMLENSSDRSETIEQILFGSFHEMAHVKIMLEADRSGLANMQVQIDYERRKKIESANDRRKEVSYQPAYRMFNNVLEDIVVNEAVLNSGYFFEANGAEQSRRTKKVRDWYVTKGFSLFRKKNNKKNSKDYGEILTEKDFAQGIDWGEIEPDNLHRRGQFISFLIKGEMTRAVGLREKDIYDPEINPDGITKLDPDVAKAFLLPLPKAYEYLLKKTEEFLAGDPEKKRRYHKFMSYSVALPIYEWNEDRGNVVKEEKVYHTVCEPRYLEGKSGGVSGATFVYGSELDREMMSLMGMRDAKSMTFIDLIQEFKKLKMLARGATTHEFKLHYVERTHLMRKYLEPIFTLLCILDDSFTANVMTGNTPGGEGKKGKPEKNPTPEHKSKIEFSVGMKVRVIETGKVGIISDVSIENGKTVGVQIDYLEESLQKLADDVQLSGESEYVTDPAKKLEVIKKRPKSLTRQSQEDNSEIKFVYEDDDEDKDEDDDEDENDDKNSSESPSDDREKEIKKNMDKQLEQLKAMLDDFKDEEDKKLNLTKVKNKKRTSEYNKNKEKAKRRGDLMGKIKEKLRKQRKEMDEKLIQENIDKFFKIEEQLRPYLVQMAEEWAKILNNIASKITLIRERYFPSGKIEPEKLQMLIPELEAGGTYEKQRVFSRLVDKTEAELRPKALRAVVIMDNSGSMDENKIKNLKLALMLLQGSLRDLKTMFKSKMQDLFGDSTDFQIKIDTQLQIFSNPDRGHTKIIKPFECDSVEDLLKKKDEVGYEQNLEFTADTIMAMSELGVNMGGTDPTLAFNQLQNVHSEDDLDRIKRGEVTEIVFLVTDGGMNGENITVHINGVVQKLEDVDNIAVAGFAIANSPGDETALDALCKMVKPEQVRKADTPKMIASEFGSLLRALVKEKFEKTMIDYLQQVQKGLDQRLG